MRALGCLIVAAVAATAASQALAQQAPGGGGGSRFLGGEDEPPGAYASPSAIPEGAVDERFGLSRTQGRISLDPIELPDGVGRSFDPGGFQPPSLPASLPAFAPQMLPSPNVVRPENALVLDARLEEDGEMIPDGLVWRLFSETAKPDGQLQLIGVARGGEAAFDVPAGTYLLHVGYGRAGLTKRIEFSGLRTRETVTLEAGGLRLSATAAPGAGPIKSDKLAFDVFSEATPERERQLVASGVPAGVVLRLNKGTYHVVSTYGETKSRADLTVETGRITNAQLQHHAGQLTMKLVREPGGEAIADTAWSIVSSQGDLVGGSVGAFSSMVLAEGDYLIVAKNRDRTYQRELTVEAGGAEEVELLISESNAVPGSETFGSGD